MVILVDKKIFVIDDSVLSGMVSKNGSDANSKKMFDMLLEMKEKNVPFKAFSHIGSLLRTIWLTKEIDSSKLKKMLDIIVFCPAPDFKNKAIMVGEVLKLATLVDAKGTRSGGGAS